ncbi:MAG: RlmE family RNA methyltransferase [Panacagrimonas sp.]
MSRKRSASSSRWLAEHEKDLHVQRARELGYRSRAVFKLEEIQRKDQILKAGMTVVDLGAAPGGWSQMARPLLGKNGTLIALDILPMAPLKDVTFIQGDFRDTACLQAVEAALKGRCSLDLVMSDMAPNVSGIGVADQAAAIYLNELAMDFAQQHLRPKGSLLMKVFDGDGFDGLRQAIRARFASVTVRKPTASRPRSRELYLLARNFNGV